MRTPRCARPGEAESLPAAPAEGLPEAEADDRLRRLGPNELPAPRKPRLPARFAAQLREPMALLLLAAALVAGVVLGERVAATAVGAIVLLNSSSRWSRRGGPPGPSRPSGATTPSPG